MSGDALLDSVVALSSSTLATNFYLPESDVDGGFASTAAERRDRLRAHLQRVRTADLVVVGEAAGWKGARQSGVAFTSPKVVGLGKTTEASATIVHGMLADLGIADRTLLWNAFPLHPHDLGSPRTNRTPTDAELDDGRPTLRLAVAGRRIVCVGAKARRSVALVLGVEPPLVDDASASDEAVAIRHPANGGAPWFRAEFDTVGRLWSLS